MKGLEDRIDAFLGDPSIGSVTGIRRMPRRELMDVVEERILLMHPDATISRVHEGGVYDGVSEYVLVDDPHDALRLIDTIPEGRILFSAQELCHQVPVVLRGAHGVDSCSL